MNAANTSVIVAGARTPVGRLMGSLSGFSGSELAASRSGQHWPRRVCPMIGSST